MFRRQLVPSSSGQYMDRYQRFSGTTRLKPLFTNYYTVLPLRRCNLATSLTACNLTVGVRTGSVGFAQANNNVSKFGIFVSHSLSFYFQAQFSF